MNATNKEHTGGYENGKIHCNHTELTPDNIPTSLETHITFPIPSITAQIETYSPLTEYHQELPTRRDTFSPHHPSTSAAIHQSLSVVENLGEQTMMPSIFRGVRATMGIF